MPPRSISPVATFAQKHEPGTFGRSINLNDCPFSDGSVGRDFMMVDDDETSLHRKYGYAIMALSVVVLAVLMVGLLGTF